MQKRGVVVEDAVLEYLSDLVRVLYRKHYFSFWKNAEAFVRKLYKAVTEKIHTLKHNPAPAENQVYGDFYIVVKMHKGFAYHAYFKIINNTYHKNIKQ
ncbi:MAG: hypothetical protein KF900_07055 [Bacteroidetes bacterium]|nr:hypothetical protein [Bacteroidota bacterium]